MAHNTNPECAPPPWPPEPSSGEPDPVAPSHDIRWREINRGLATGLLCNFVLLALFGLGFVAWMILLIVSFRTGRNRTYAISLLAGGLVGMAIWLGICVRLMCRS